MPAGEAQSEKSAVQQLVRLVASGYRYFVSGVIPAAKSPAAVDRKLDQLYELSIGADRRFRRKARGLSNVMYVRFGRCFYLLATPPLDGHRFLKREASVVADIRTVPIRIGAYAIKSCRNRSDATWRVSVRVRRETYLELCEEGRSIASRFDSAAVERFIRNQRLLRYDPVKWQLRRVLAAANTELARRGLSEASTLCLPTGVDSATTYGRPASQNMSNQHM